LTRQGREALNAGRSYIKHISAEAHCRGGEGQSFSASADFSRISAVEAVDHLRWPTPLTKNREPDISFISTRQSPRPS